MPEAVQLSQGASASSGAVAPPPIAIRRIGRDTATYAAGVLINRAAAFVMLPIYTRHLTPADYAVIQLIEMTLDFIAILAGARLVVGVFRYYHSAESEAERRAVTSTSLFLICGAYGVVSIGVAIAAPVLSRLIFEDSSRALLIRLSAVGLIGQSMFIVPLAYARARGRSRQFVTANLALLAMQIALNVLFLVHYRLGPLAMFLSNAIASTTIGTVLAARLVREIGLHYSRNAARRLVHYGLPLVATQLASFISTFGDRYVLEHGTDLDPTARLTMVGLYSLAYQFGFLLVMVGSMPIDLVWEPMRFSLVERPNRDFVLSRAFVYLNLLLISVALGITLFVDGILRVMADPKYYPAAKLVPIILVAYVFQSWTGMHDVGIHYRERTKYITIGNWIAAGVAVIGYFALIPRWYGFGAAIATVIAFAVRYVIIARISLRLLPVRYDWASIRRLVGIAGIVALAALLAPIDNVVTAFGFRAGLFIAYAVAVWHFRVLTPGERSAARRFVRDRVVRLRARLVPV